MNVPSLPMIPGASASGFGTNKLRSVGEVTASSGVKSIIYGAAGIGKTRLIGSCPSPMIISNERGLLSLRQGYAHVPVWEVKTMADLFEAHQFVMQSAEAKRYDTVALDSMSDLAEVLLAHEKHVNIDKRNNFKPYEVLAEQFMKLMRDFRALENKHVYFIAKEEYSKDANGMFMYQPSMPGKQLSLNIPYLVDELFRLTQFTDPNTQQLTLALQCQLTPTVLAKDRSGMLAAYEPYNLGAIFDKIMRSGG